MNTILRSDKLKHVHSDIRGPVYFEALRMQKEGIDVLRLNTEGLLLITGMANPQVIRTAEMADIPFILFVRDKQITAEMQQLAEENEILLLRCRQSMFRVCGELYKAGLLPVY